MGIFSRSFLDGDRFLTGDVFGGAFLNDDGAPPPEEGPSLDFSIEENSQYLALIEDF
jgi:hypothetical protein